MTAATINKFRQSAAEIDRQQVAKMLTGIVKNFQRKSGGDYNELLQVAHLAFMQARKAYNHRRTGFQGKTVKFSSWVYTKVWYALRDHSRDSYRWGQEFPISGVDAEALKIPHDFDGPKEQVIPDRIRFSPKQFANEVSDDAATILSTLVDQGVHGKYADEIQHCLLRRMVEDFGWGVKRFWVAVSELREALSS